MRVSLNGYFLTNPDTGSGQYTLNLLAHLDAYMAVAKPPGQPGNLAKLLWEQRGWSAAAKKAGADILHSPYFALPLWRSIPAVVTIHDLIPMVLPAYRGSPFVRAYTWLQALASRSAEAIMVDSQCSKRDVLRVLRVPEARVHVTYLGVDARFCPDESAENPIGQPYVFYLGGLDVRKNVPALIRAFAEIAPEYPDLVLVIAGQLRPTSPMFPDLPSLAGPLGVRVRFLGRVSDDAETRPLSLCQGIRLSITVRRFWPGSLEALACGCPVVCSNASSLPEIVGDAAVSFDPRDELALAAALRRALDEPEPLRAKGPIQAAKFNWERTAQQTAAVYEGLKAPH